MASSAKDSRPAGERIFATTHWSLVLSARGDSTGAEDALARLCGAYWYPLYGFVRRQGHSPHDAQDLTQEFFARLLDSHSLERVGPEKGRFRTYLLASLSHFLANDWRDSQRLKRGGGSRFVSWDGLNPDQQFQHEPNAAAETWFDRNWAQAVVATALRRLGDEMIRDGVKDRFDAFKIFLQGDAGASSYAEAARSCGLSEPATKTAIFRLRRRYGELIREEVAATVGPGGDVEAEIQYLITVLGST